MKLQLLDELIALSHGEERSTDCLIAVKVKNAPELNIKRAQELFPKTAKSVMPITTSQMTTVPAAMTQNRLATATESSPAGCSMLCSETQAASSGAQLASAKDFTSRK